MCTSWTSQKAWLNDSPHLTHPPLHNNNSNLNNKYIIVRDKVLTMTTTTTTTQIFINLNNLPAKWKESFRHIYHEMLACVYIFHEKLLKCVF